MELLSFDEFIEYVTEHIVDYLDELGDVEIEVDDIIKNNSVSYKALKIKVEDKNCTPSINLNNLYSEYRYTGVMDTVLRAAVEIYKEHCDDISVNVDMIYNYDYIKSRIIMRLVNYERNEEILNKCPHIMIHDLAVTFRWVADYYDGGIATAIVTDKELECWGVTVDELYEVALSNTMRLFPTYCDNMENICINSIEDPVKRELVRKEYEAAELDKVPMLVLSNDKRINGATSILYPEYLESISKELGGDFYILPSSVHEVIAFSTEMDIDKDHLAMMVKSANDTVVDESDILSYSVYLYDSEEDELLVV